MDSGQKAYGKRIEEATMSDESRREVDRVDVMKKIREAKQILRIAEDVNEEWRFISEETFEKLNDALSRMVIEINRNEDVIL